MNRKTFYYNGKSSSFSFLIIIFLMFLGFIFFVFFGALTFLFFGALGIGASLLRKIFPNENSREKKIKKQKSNGIITLEKDDYKIVDD
ncbi:MAG: hypothetical protein ACRENO_09500 [Thermodesulfobacteriota bacterium]